MLHLFIFLPSSAFISHQKLSRAAKAIARFSLEVSANQVGLFENPYIRKVEMIFVFTNWLFEKSNCRDKNAITCNVWVYCKLFHITQIHALNYDFSKA